MRRNIPTMFAILLLCTLVLCSACVGPGAETQKQNSSKSSESPQQNTGLVQVTVPSAYSRISFETALQRFRDQTRAGKERLYYILAKDLDVQGNATLWIFGVNDGTGSRYLMFDRTSKIEMPLGSSSLPVKEIVPDRVVPPGKLFSDNNETLFGNPAASAPELRELELSEGTYTLTIISGKTARVVRMNAATGALVG